jgi:transposase InsO family protein
MIPVRQATTIATIKALKERIFSSFSAPETLVSDNALCFTSKEFRQFCFERGVKHVTTYPYYPQPSRAERFNRNIRAALIAYHSNAHDTWDQNLTWLQLGFNTAEYESTKAAPFVVVFPFRSGSPLLNLWKINDLLPDKCNKKVMKQKWTAVKQNVCNTQVNIANRCNRNRVPKPFKEGDLVYYRNHPVSYAGRQITAKLMPHYKGPFKVDKFLTPVTDRLVDPTNGNFVTRPHVSFLKPGPSVQD